MLDYIHNDAEFKDLLLVVSSQKRIDITLVEKDYWILHTLYSLSQQGIEFELKGGTSLSKGYALIHRFSEDIDIHIRTNYGLMVEGKEDKAHIKAARQQFYNVFANSLSINGIVSIERDYAFDDKIKYRSGGIRLYYKSHTPVIAGLKDGILLEAGFDTVTPNTPMDISSWVWDYLVSMGIHNNYINNTAIGIKCYHPGYTLIEKIQAIIRKFRNSNNNGVPDAINFMRQYYDVYCLLGNADIQAFIGSVEYAKHKATRIKGQDNLIPIHEHPAFLLHDSDMRESFKNRYQATSSLYYNGQPDFDDILARIQLHLNRL